MDVLSSLLSVVLIPIIKDYCYAQNSYPLTYYFSHYPVKKVENVLLGRMSVKLSTMSKRRPYLCIYVLKEV